MKAMPYKLRLLIETLLIIAGCEGMIMLLLPVLLPGVSGGRETLADTTLLTLAAGPLLWWRFHRHHRVLDAWRGTEIERATQALLQANAQLQNEVVERERAQSFLNSVVEHLPIPVFIKEAKELRFILWNKAGEKLTGIPNAEMIGKNDHDFFPAAHAERNISKDRATFEKKDVLEIPEEVLQTRHHGARIVHVWKVPIFDAAGQPAFLLGICEDITERKRAEMAMRGAMLTLDSTRDGVFMFDPATLRFSYVNQGAIDQIGYSREQLLAMTPVDIKPEFDEPRFRQMIAPLIAAPGQVHNFTTRHCRKDGSHLPVEINLQCVILEEGSARMIAIVRDITERKKAEQRHALQHAINCILSDATTLAAAMPRILCAITESLGFELSAYWQVNREAGTIQCQAVWHKPDERLAAFAAASREYALHPGEGLPGRVWSEGKLAGISSVLHDENFRRTIPARAAGLIGAFGFPLVLGGEIIGTIECFSRQSYEPDALLCETLASVGNQIALFNERKLAAKKLADNEHHLRLILEAVPECVKLVAADGTLLDMNPAGLAMVEVDRLDQVVGQNLQGFLTPAYRPMFEKVSAAVFRGEPQTAEFELIGRKGTHRWMETCAVPLRDGEGRITAQLAVTRDVTKRRQAEELLRLQEAALRSAANVIVITDRKGLIVWVNPAFTEVTGYTAEEALGQNPRILKQKNLSANHSTAFYRDLWKTIISGAVWHGEFQNSHKNGSPLVEEATITPVRDEEGKITHFVAVKQNITERKRAEEKLAQMQKELLEVSRQAGMAEVATGVLHNVGNVLNSVNVAATCVADKLRRSKAANLAKVVAMLREHEQDLGAFLTSDLKGKQVPGYLAQLSEHLANEQTGVQQELAGLQKHIDHIKDIVVRQQSFAKVSGVTETLAAADLVEDALRMQDTSLLRHEITVIKEFGEVPPLTVEKHKALHILVNLMNNAKQACLATNRDDKQMTLRVMNGVNRIKIEVADNGVGIAPENLTRIFAHGFTTKKNGHGFGLHSGALAARELGGSLSVHSEGVGRGAVFTLELPVKPLETLYA